MFCNCPQIPGRSSVGPGMLPKFFQNQRVGRRELERRKFETINPAHRLRSERTRFAGEPAAGEEADQNALAGIGMFDLLEGRDNFDLRPQFFADLADDAGLEGLTWLQFAAGKLPISAQMISRPPLCDEEPALPENERRRDPDDAWNRTPGVFDRLGQVCRSGRERHTVVPLPVQRPMLL